MKYLQLYIVIAVCTIFSACKKTRTCTCGHTTTLTKVTAPRSGTQPFTSVEKTYGELSISYDKIKKKEMRRIIGCNSRIETSKDTYTTTVPVVTATVISGTSYTTPIYFDADVVATTDVEYKCELK